MATRALRDFQRAVKRFSKTVPAEQAVLLQKKVSFQVLEGVTDGTPIDTGRARANWQAGVNSVPTGEVAVGSNPFAAREANLAEIPPFAIVYITNNVPYIEALELGHSRQAKYFIRNTLVRVRAQFP